MSRPASSFHHFVGQQRVVRHLERLINGAKAHGDPCTSVLLTGPAGYGKSSIAKAIAKEYGSNFHVLIAGSDTKPSEVCDVLREIKHGDVFLVDEAHSLSRDAQQLFYVALDQWRIPTPTERGLNRSQFESIAQFTLILATNEPGGIRHALRSRLTRIEFDPYTQKELKEIAERIAGTRGIEVSPQAANLLAKTSQGSPRSIARRIDNIKHFWSSEKSLTKDHVREFLGSEGVDESGRTPHQREYLKCLTASPKGQCNLERLAVRLGCDVVNVRQEVEPYLIEQELIDPASRLGRGITEKGRQFVQEFCQEPNDSKGNEHDDGPCR